LKHNLGMDNDEFVISIVNDGPEDQEGLEEACFRLSEELREIADVRVSRIPAPAPMAGTRSAGEWVSAVVVVSALVGRVATRERLDERMKHLLAEIRTITDDWAQRNKGKRVKVRLPDGTTIETTGVSDRAAGKIVRNLPPGPRNNAG
jgi:hypothetical protein